MSVDPSLRPRVLSRRRLLRAAGAAGGLAPLGFFEGRVWAGGGSTDQPLEAIATGKADAGVGMALRRLKPPEQGFDVRITTAIHGGCMRLLAAHDSDINSVADLKGKTVGVISGRRSATRQQPTTITVPAPDAAPERLRAPA